MKIRPVRAELFHVDRQTDMTNLRVSFRNFVLMKLEFSRQIFEKKHSNVKFHENPSSWSRVVPRGQTDRHDEAKNRFSQFCDTAQQKKGRLTGLVTCSK